jgi:HlyD family secretion protein
MKSKLLILPAILLLILAACGGGKSSTAIPTIVLDNPGSTPASTTGPGGGGAGVTASGFIVADQQAEMAFRLAGNVKQVNVAVGEAVQAGQVLIQMDDTTEQIQLDQANLALLELTSSSALAQAQKLVAQDQQDVYNAQVGLNNLTAQHDNQALISNAQAGLVLAQNALDDAQTAYDNTSGDAQRDSPKARAYQKLYTAQQNYNNALYIYNIYTGKSNQAQVDERTATLALAKAKLAEDQTLVAALTGGSLPANPTGQGYVTLMQARLAVQAAQANLDATRLVAPFAGTVGFVKASVGDYVSPGQLMVGLGDVQHFHVETTDLSERDLPNVKVGQTVTVSVKALNRNISGKVSGISSLAGTLGGDVVYQVIIKLDEIPAQLRSGMSVDVQFNSN